MKRRNCATILAIGLLVIIGTVTGCAERFIGTKRVPREIPLGALLNAQVEALGPAWSLNTNNDMIDTNTNSTSGAWTYWTSLNNVNWRYDASLQFHTYRSPSLAKSHLSPSPMAVNVDKDGNLPLGWDYTPPNADRFILDCTPEPLPKGCYVLLVYQEYSFVFAVDIAEAASLEDLQRFLQVTDTFMADFLSSTELDQGRRRIPTLSELGIQPDG